MVGQARVSFSLYLCFVLTIAIVPNVGLEPPMSCHWEENFFWQLCGSLGLYLTGINIYVHRLSPLVIKTTLEYQWYLLLPVLEMRKLRLRDVKWKQSLNPGLSDFRPFSSYYICYSLSGICILLIKKSGEDLMEFWWQIIFVPQIKFCTIANRFRLKIGSKTSWRMRLLCSLALSGEAKVCLHLHSNYPKPLICSVTVHNN